jgi:hypothetical protein
MEKISSTDRGKNEEVLRRVKEDRNILHTIKRRKAKWICDILRRNCILRHAKEGKTKGRGKRERRHKHLLDDLKETRNYWKLKEQARRQDIVVKQR